MDHVQKFHSKCSSWAYEQFLFCKKITNSLDNAEAARGLPKDAFYHLEMHWTNQITCLRASVRQSPMPFTEVWLITQLGYSGMLHCVSGRVVQLFNTIKYRAVTLLALKNKSIDQPAADWQTWSNMTSLFLCFGTNEFAVKYCQLTRLNEWFTTVKCKSDTTHTRSTGFLLKCIMTKTVNMQFFVIVKVAQYFLTFLPCLPFSSSSSMVSIEDL